MALFRKYSALVLDVGGVLLFNPSIKSLSLPRRVVLNALDTPVWHELERGKISEDECNVAVCAQFGISLEQWAQAITVMRGTLKPNTDFILTVKKLKEDNPGLRVFGLSNMPDHAYDQLKPQLDSWGIFDEFVSSSELGLRKPDVVAYEKFLERCKLKAESCVFVDDRLENVVAAHALGFQGILFEDTESTALKLRQLFTDPVAEGWNYLRANANKMFCELNTGGIQPDNFSQLVILENTGDRDLVTIERLGSTVNYFIGEPIFADTRYADDSDTTSMAMLNLDDVTSEDKAAAMKAILANLNPDGLPMCWFDPSRPRFCHCVCACSFRFFYLNDQASKLPGVYEYLCQMLRSGSFLFGTRYYTTPEWFFFHLGNLCGKRPDDPALSEMRELLVWRIQERQGMGGDDLLGCVLRTLASQALGMKQNTRDLEALLDAQQADGGWKMVWVWKYGKEGFKLGSRGIITAMAVKAIEYAQKME